jgi:hypothetical protein
VALHSPRATGPALPASECIIMSADEWLDPLAGFLTEWAKINSEGCRRCLNSLILALQEENCYEPMEWLLGAKQPPEFPDDGARRGAARAIVRVLERVRLTATERQALGQLHCRALQAAKDRLNAQDGDRQTAPGKVADPEQQLDPVAKSALDIIRRQKKDKGIDGNSLVAALEKKGKDITRATLYRHIVPALRPFGVINDRQRGGYLIPTSGEKL